MDLQTRQQKQSTEWTHQNSNVEIAILENWKEFSYFGLRIILQLNQQSTQIIDILLQFSLTKSSPKMIHAIQTVKLINCTRKNGL